ncbi:MAG TPA: hypothetical protein VIK63_03485 [Haloplasmataceae bacterium]
MMVESQPYQKRACSSSEWREAFFLQLEAVLDLTCAFLDAANEEEQVSMAVRLVAVREELVQLLQQAENDAVNDPYIRKCVQEVVSFDNQIKERMEVLRDQLGKRIRTLWQHKRQRTAYAGKGFVDAYFFDRKR